MSTMNFINERASTNTVVINTASVKEQKAEIFDFVTAKITVENANGEAVTRTKTATELFTALHDINYAIPINKALFIAAFGEKFGDPYAKKIRLIGEKLTAALLIYHEEKMTGVKADIIKARENEIFAAIKEYLTTFGYITKKDFKLNKYTVSNLAAKAYRAAYSNRNDISKGYKAVKISGYTMINLMLKEVMVEKTFTDAANSASIAYCGNYKKLLENGTLDAAEKVE